MKRKTMTTKQLHEHMQKPRCFHCGLVKEDHVATVSGEVRCAIYNGVTTYCTEKEKP